MRLTAKLVLLFVAVVVIVLGGSAWLQYRRDASAFEQERRRDAFFAIRILAHDVAVTWRHEDRRAALELLADPALAAQHYDARWVEDLRLAHGAPPDLASGSVEAIRAGDHVETWAAVRTPGGALGAVVLRESLAAERAYLTKAIRRAAITSAVLALFATLATGLLGSYVIGAPTRRLVEKARRIGAGDLSGPLAMRQRDEVGEIAREIDAMCERLAQARARLDVETDRRIAAVEQLRHADRLMTVGKLASGIAHELGTPINVVSGRAQMIATGEVTGDEVVESARVVVDQAKRMARIIRQLLDFARRGKSERRRQDVAAPVGHATHLLETMAKKQSVALVVETPTTVEAEVDEGQLEQVVTNLVVNAIQATPAGGTVTVDVAAVDATSPTGAATPCARLRVRDTGRGMDAATRARIFEPFFTTKDVGEGTGLGLAVVWGIVSDHGGWVDVDSAPGAGTTVTVHLPVTAPSERATAA